MALFEFELESVADIEPWETHDGPSLSWFALTDGLFRMPVGNQVLFEYSGGFMAHRESKVRIAHYQIAAFVREMLGSVAAGTARLPERIERLASNWDALAELQKRTDEVGCSEEHDHLFYSAWSWVGERSPLASYLVAAPNFQFVRIGEELRIHWDNRDRVVDGARVWTAEHGVHSMPVGEFARECKDFAERLLNEMELRIAGIEQAAIQPRIAVSIASLREQQENWRAEFDSYFTEYQPEIPWQETERAIEAIANRRGLQFY